MSEQTTVLVADDHPLFREGVVRSLREVGGFDVVGEAASAAEAVAAVGEHMPEIALLDISMPGGGVEAAREIGLRFPAVRIVMLTVSEDDDDVISSMRAGASGYLLKGVSATALAEVLRSIAAGGSYVSPTLAGRVLGAIRSDEPQSAQDDAMSALTRREEQILELVSRGLSNREVGEALKLQEKTIKHYMTNILQKLHVRNRVEAAVLARGR